MERRSNGIFVLPCAASLVSMFGLYCLVVSVFFAWFADWLLEGRFAYFTSTMNAPFLFEMVAPLAILSGGIFNGLRRQRDLV